MKKAYLVLAHKSPEQLYRLVEALADGNSTIFVHIDKQVDISHFDRLYSFGETVQIIERFSTSWAAIGIVDATLNGLKAVKLFDPSFERIILLSGQDYPIKSSEYIDNFFTTSSYSVFIDYFPLPNHVKWKTDKGGMYRVNKYYFGLKMYHLFASKSLNFLAEFFPVLKRKIPGNMEPFAGSQWWIINMYALTYILDYVENHPEYRAFHIDTFAPDELFFHMILANATDEKLRRSITNDNKRFMKWQTSCIAHPEILKTSDLEDIVKSKALFARKFDYQQDSQVLDMIDANCLQPVSRY